MSNQNMDTAAWGAFRRLFYIVAIALAALLALTWLAGYGPGGSKCKVPVASASSVAAATTPAPAAPAPVPAPAPVAATTATGAAAAVAAPAVAQVPVAEAVPRATIYFAVDKYDLPMDTDKTLADVVTYIKANPGAKASVSGFHDPTGNQAHNEELALNRARAVRGALEGAGIGRDRIVMEKPQKTTGTGTAREARRVEVTIF